MVLHRPVECTRQIRTRQDYGQGFVKVSFKLTVAVSRGLTVMHCTDAWFRTAKSKSSYDFGESAGTANTRYFPGISQSTSKRPFALEENEETFLWSGIERNSFASGITMIRNARTGIPLLTT